MINYIKDANGDILLKPIKVERQIIKAEIDQLQSQIGTYQAQKDEATTKLVELKAQVDELKALL